MKFLPTSFCLTALSALLLAYAWWIPGTVSSALLTWGSITLLIAYLRCPTVQLAPLILHGAICNLFGFYWLYSTIKDFGGLPTIAALIVFGLFVILSCNQQLIFFWLYKKLPNIFMHFYIGSALAWTTAELISIRIFPWSLSHTQVAIPEISQIASIIGSPGLCFFMLWLTESIFMSFKHKKLLSAVPALTVFILAIGYNSYQISQLSDLIKNPTQEVSLIQGNVTIQDKHNVKYFEINQQRYLELSKKIQKPGSLIIWPESVITSFMPDNLRHVEEDQRLPNLSTGPSILLGGLTYQSQTELFNSAIAITASGAVLKPYHKQILMPFGEYTPFSNLWPWLKNLNATAGNFTPGKEIQVFEYPENQLLRVAPLICYEDIVQDLATAATVRGATVLVNLTNDAWFGDSVAPYQHNLIASFRAIENRRYLLRATNTGLTAIIDPLGRTVNHLPLFSEGILTAKIQPLEELSIYSKYLAPYINYLIMGVTILALLANLVIGHKNSQFR